MTETKYQLNDLKLRLVGIPFLSLAIPLVVHFEDFKEMNNAYFVTVIISFCTTVALWEGNRYIIVGMRRMFPQYSQTTKRILLESVLALLYTLVATFILDEVLCKGILHKEGNLMGFRISVIPTVLVYLIYEATYFF